MTPQRDVGIIVHKITYATRPDDLAQSSAATRSRANSSAIVAAVQ